MIRIAVVMLGLVLIPIAGSAADMNAQYIVDLKVLKKNAPAGTSLTFELHGNSACTALVDSTVVNVEAVDLIEQVKSMKVKGGPKMPKVARLTELLTGVTKAPFLKVTGPGITPVGGECQLQDQALRGISGWEINDASNQTTVACSSASKVILGGGCYCTGGTSPYSYTPLRGSQPNNYFGVPDEWACRCWNPDSPNDHDPYPPSHIWVICADEE